MAGSPTRSLCALGCSRPATHFCYCDFNETFLCTEHSSTHEESHTSEQHFRPLPLLAYGHHQNFGYYDRLKTRQEGWEAGVKVLQQNLTELDKCMTEFADLIEERIWELTDFAYKKQAELEVWKQNMSERIANAVNLVESTFYEDEPELTDSLARVLRGYIPGSDTLRLFTYDMRPDLLPSVSNEVLTTELLEPKELSLERMSKMNTMEGISPKLIRIEDQALSIFDFEQNRWKSPLSLTRQVGTSGHRFCLQSDTEVFLCGGKDSAGVMLKSCFEVDFQGRVNCKSDMTIARSLHGLVYFAGFRFVFGGETTSETSVSRDSTRAESLELCGDSWRQLPDMRYPRKNFQPAIWRLSLFLCGGEQLLIEELELESRQMRLHSISLPEASKANLAYVLDDDLVVLGKNWLLRLGLKDNKLYLKTRSQHGNGADPYSRAMPVVRGSEIYVSSGLKCVVYSAGSGKKIKEF